MITYVNELRTYTCNTDWILRFFRCNSDECGAIIRVNQTYYDPSTGERNSEYSDNLV
jgi:hypothetical protein